MDYPTIIIDTREQRPWAFPEWISVRRGTLQQGDYALEGDPNFAIERKSLDDFVGTLFSGWNRFRRELSRMVDNGFVARVVIVEADFESLMWRDGGNGDLIAPEHRHPRITPQAVAIRLAELTMMGVTVLFCSDPDHAAGMAYNLLMVRHAQIERKILNLEIGAPASEAKN